MLSDDTRVSSKLDVQFVSAAFVRAFCDDPAMMFVIPDEEARIAKLPPIFKMPLRLAMPHGLCRAMQGHQSAAMRELNR